MKLFLLLLIDWSYPRTISHLCASMLKVIFAVIEVEYSLIEFYNKLVFVLVFWSRQVFRRLTEHFGLTGNGAARCVGWHDVSLESELCCSW